MKKLLTEIFNIKNASRKAKDGHTYQIAYIDPSTSENTFDFRNKIKEFGAKYFSDLKAWGWFLGADPQNVYNNKIKPCLDYLTQVEDNGQGTRVNQVTIIIDELINDLQSGNVEAINPVNAKNLTDELNQYKADLIACTSSEEFQNKLLPIIKFQQAQGHHCSFGNALLIMFQDPEAKMVKSKTAWFNMNREVVDTSHPIMLWRPDKEQLDKDKKEVIRQQFLNGCGVSSVKDLTPGQREELNVQLSGGDIKKNEEGRSKFKTYFAYDIRFTRQIEGKPELVGDTSGTEDLEWYDKSEEQSEWVEYLMQATIEMVKDSSVQVEYVPMESLNGALGVSTGGKIRLPEGGKATQNAIATIWHEFAHELLHQKFLHSLDNNSEFSQQYLGRTGGRGLIEQQAELTAWVVCKYFKLDRIFSLNYAGGWGAFRDVKQTARLFDQVANAASLIIRKVGDNFEKLKQSNGVV